MSGNQTEEKAAILFIGDTHCGGSTALLPPKSYAAGRPIGQTDLDKKMWRYYATDLEEFVAQAKEFGAEKIIVTHLGDLIDGDHHQTTEVVTASITEQLEIAKNALNPILKEATHFIQVSGTPVHNEFGTADSQFCNWVATEFPQMFVKYGKQVFLEVCGHLIDLQHEGKQGVGRPWTRNNQLGVICQSRKLECLDNELPVPELIVRAHKHFCRDSGGDYLSGKYPIRYLQLGCWQLSTEYGRSLGSGNPDIAISWAMVDLEKINITTKYHNDLHKMNTKNNTFKL